MRDSTEAEDADEDDEDEHGAALDFASKKEINNTQRIEGSGMMSLSVRPPAPPSPARPNSVFIGCRA